MKKLLDNKTLCVRDGKNFKLSKQATDYADGFHDKTKLKANLESYKEKIEVLQGKLFAQSRYSLLLVLQAIDTAGKDSCIKHVLSGINPQGCDVVSFKQPTREELDHDFLWRAYKQMPKRGHIGVFNRSYYEEVLVTKVHPELILGENIPGIDSVKDIDDKFWEDRYRAINEMERHLVRNGTVVIKVFLNLGKNEQKNRLLERIDNPDKQWKFDYSDLKERRLWDEYLHAYQDMIRHTATKHAPWYVIPADNQWIGRAMVGEILLETLSSLKLSFPLLEKDSKVQLGNARNELLSEK